MQQLAAAIVTPLWRWLGTAFINMPKRQDYILLQMSFSDNLVIPCGNLP
jgi:hypothetical protein